MLIVKFFFIVELSTDQQKLLIEIRRRKAELLLEIQVSMKFYVTVFPTSYVILLN